MDYKKYYEEIKEKLTKYSDVIYYEPMSNNEISEIEKSLGILIKPLYREYLSSFGMTQDIFDELRTSLDSFIDEIDFMGAPLEDYLPIFSDNEEEDVIYLINNTNIQDDYVYVVKVDNNDKIGEIKKLKQFNKIIEESLFKIKNSYKSRCLNKNKINIIEFIISGKDFITFYDIFSNLGLKQKSEWNSKYKPVNIFCDEIATFELYNEKILFERNADKSKYRFEIEEPILIDKEKSIILKIEELLKLKKIKHEKIECKLIENE